MCPAPGQKACGRRPAEVFDDDCGAGCPSPAGWPKRESSGRNGEPGDALREAKADATLLWLKAQEDAGLDVVTDGEQSRQHFVHGTSWSA